MPENVVYTKYSVHPALYCDSVGSAKQQGNPQGKSGKILIMLNNKQKTLKPKNWFP
jgi:hypothetical protein